MRTRRQPYCGRCKKPVDLGQDLKLIHIETGRESCYEAEFPKAVPSMVQMFPEFRPER